MLDSDSVQSKNDFRQLAEERLRAASGVRLTEQRREILAVLLESTDHPGAAEVFQRAGTRLDNLSLATVYNCLETLSEKGVIVQVTGDRHNARYCANLTEHAHFYCVQCGAVFDLHATHSRSVKELWSLPDGALVDRVDVSIHGTCAHCAKDLSS